MRFIQIKKAIDEIISLATPPQSGNNERLSQKLKAVRHTAKHGFFIAPTQGKPTPFYRTQFCVLCHLMGRLRLQNKPFGEYATWLLLVPRVRPSHPIFRVFTQKLKGVFA